MALIRSKRSEVPKDAVIVTEEEALTYQWKIISNWEKKSDVWALRFAPGVLGAMAAFSGAFVNNHYRRKLRLGTYGRMSTYMPIVVIPTIFTVLSHKFFVQRPIMLEDPLEVCPLCTQMRAATFQVSLGVIYPTLLSPFAGFMFATRHFTYRLPSATEKPMEVLQLWRKMTKPIQPILGALIAGQAIIAMYLTYKESEQSFRLQLEMEKIEHRLEEELELAKQLKQNNMY